MLEEIFADLPARFVSGAVEESISFYFSLDTCKRTVYLSPDSCSIEEGRTTDSADCVCKTSPDFFLKIWRDDYRPSVADFLAGTIK